MCGRFGASYRDLKTVWNLHGDFSFQKRYNIAPSQEVPVIIRNEGRNEAKVIKWELRAVLGSRFEHGPADDQTPDLKRCSKSRRLDKPYRKDAA
jgi:putative SOS response-associated peptidase YedK